MALVLRVAGPPRTALCLAARRMYAVDMAAVKQLRAATKAGVMACRDALDACGGDVGECARTESAATHARVAAKAQALLLQSSGRSREGKVAAEGLVASATGPGAAAAVEVACETDFVARGASLAALGEECAAAALRLSGTVAAEALAAAVAAEVATTLAAVKRATGEAVSVRRALSVRGPHVAAYVHRPSGVGRVVGLAATTHADNHRVAVHVASLDAGADPLAAPFGAGGSSQPLSQALAARGHALVAHARLEVGEGVEVAATDFAEEVRRQVEGRT